MEDFEEIIGRCSVVLGMRGHTVSEVVTELVGAMVSSSELDASLADGAISAVLEREQLGSTAISGGIAIPHGYIDGISGTAVAIGVQPEGIQCGAADGEPSRIFVLMLNASQTATGHIKFLVSLNQRLLQSSVREGILVANTREGVVSALCG